MSLCFPSMDMEIRSNLFRTLLAVEVTIFIESFTEPRASRAAVRINLHTHHNGSLCLVF